MTDRLILVGGDAPLTRRLAERLAVARAATGDATELGALFGRSPPGAAGETRLVYLAGDRRGTGEPDPDDARRVAAAAAAAGVGHAVVVSSAAVWEPSHHHPGHVAEEPLAPLRFGDRAAALWRRLEEAVGETLGAVPATVLRPPLVPIAGGRDWASRFLAGRLRLAFPLPGFDPPLQLLDPDDLATAILRALAARRTGVYHLAPAGVVRVRSLAAS